MKTVSQILHLVDFRLSDFGFVYGSFLIVKLNLAGVFHLLIACSLQVYGNVILTDGSIVILVVLLSSSESDT